MAEKAQAKPIIDRPPAQATTGKEPDIFVMPEKFRNLAKQAPAQKFSQVAPPPPKPAPKPKSKPPVRKKKKGFPVKLVVGGVLVLAFFIAGAIIVLGTLEQPEEPTPEPLIVVPDPDPEPDPEPDPDPEPEDPFATDLRSGTDTDSDGLTDIEEELYGTNALLPDTDSDGFLDGNEIFHRYNPNGTAPATIVESGLVSLFDDPAFSYSIYYPTPWNVRITGGEEEQIIFTAPDGEVVQVIRETKTEELTLTDWFLEQDTEASADDLLEFISKEGLDSLMSPDRMTAYIDAGNSVYIVSYSAGTRTTVEYLQTFQMMLNSMLLK